MKERDNRIIQNKKKRIKKIWLMKICLCTLFSILFFSLGSNISFVSAKESGSTQKQQSEALPAYYEMVVIPAEDGTVYVTYHIERTVSKREKDGIKEMDIPLKVEKVKNVKSLGGAAKYVSFEMDEDRNSYIHVGFDRVYNVSERLVLDFQIRLFSLYKIDQTSEAMVYTFDQSYPSDFLDENCIMVWDSAFAEKTNGEKIKLEKLLEKYPDFQKMIERTRDFRILSKHDITSKVHNYYYWTGNEKQIGPASVRYSKQYFSSKQMLLANALGMSMPRWICIISILLCLSAGMYLCLSNRERFHKEAMDEIMSIYQEEHKRKGNLRSLEQDKEKLHISIQSVAEEVKQLKVHRRGMIPKISTNAVEYAIAKQRAAAIPIWLGFVLLLLMGMSLGFENSLLKKGAVIWTICFLKFCVWDTLYTELRKDDGYILDEDGIRYVRSRYSKGVLYDYSEVNEAVTKGRVRYTGTDLRIRCKHFVLCFFYEIGDSAAYRRMEKSYEKLIEKTGVKLPPFTAELAGFMDQRYYFRHKVKTSAVVMFIANMIATVLLLWKKDDIDLLLIVWVVLISIVMNIALIVMLKSAFHLRSVLSKMKEKYEKAANDGWIDNHIVMITVVISVILLLYNVWVVYTFWHI